MRLSTQPRFANVDIDLKSTADPAQLIEALSKSLMIIHLGKDGRKHWARLCFVTPKSPAHAIRRFARLLVKLPEPLRRV